MQVTTTLPVPLAVTTSTLLGIDDIDPKLMVPRFEIGVASELPKAQPLTMVAETVKDFDIVSPHAAELARVERRNKT